MNNESQFYEHALVAVLYAVKANGGDLDEFYKSVATGIISNSMRPLPQDQKRVLELVQQTISDISAT